jgi:hypothetical protein
MAKVQRRYEKKCLSGKSQKGKDVSKREITVQMSVSKDIPAHP